MLKSLVKEIVGAHGNQHLGPECLEPFIGTKRVFLIFADAEDDRALTQDALLRTAHLRLIEEDVEVFNIAGGGVFALFEGSYGIDTLDADEIRDRLDGPQPGEFGVIMLGKQGEVLLRAAEPMTPEEIFRTLDQLPKTVSW